MSLSASAYALFRRVSCVLTYIITYFLFIVVMPLQAHDSEEHSKSQSLPLVTLVEQTKPSIVGVGLYTPIHNKAPQLMGTGFVIGNGKYIVTNYHVVAKELETQYVQFFVAMSGEGPRPKIQKMNLIGMDPVHDIAILSVENALPALPLASDDYLPSGQPVFITGFPLGALLGLYPATHTGIVAAVAPDVNPARNADDLTLRMLERLSEPFLIYQLDITAFPGNSGSPVINQQSGEVIAILNKVFVSEGKEAAMSNPSGISYAIPVMHIKKLASRYDIQL